LAGSDHGSMTSPGGIQQGETEDCFIAERGDQVQSEMIEERDTECYGLRLPRVATL
jgi:hypothetical protein